MMEGEISCDQVTCFSSKGDFDSKALWLKVKSTVRDIELDDGCLIFDDTVQEKAWTDENDVMCWHFDHTKGKSVRGVNILNALYCSNGASIPAAFEIVTNRYNITIL